MDWLGFRQDAIEGALARRHLTEGGMAMFDLSSSWVEGGPPLKERVTTVTGELGCFVADTLTADLTFYQNGSESSQWDRVAAFREVSEGHVIRYVIPKSEPLMTELSNFAAAVRGESAELVTLQEGLATVRVAEALRESAATGETVEVAE